jgi:arsenate reductase-like glutaredoxin family protein
MTKFLQKNAKIYECKICSFNSSNKRNYDVHLTTSKHREMTGNDENLANLAKLFVCECGNSYKYRQGLFSHKKKCTFAVQCETAEPTSAIIDLIKQNSDFKELIIEQTKTIQEQNKSLLELASKSSTTNNNCINTNNNQKFNLNFFLNTTCKDAMNMSEFLENLDINFQDIENIGKNGYVAGMTDMILSRIRDLDVTKRPLHCTDLKRETMYIKDNDEWSKDTPEKGKLRQMITIVAKQNCGQISKWREQYPECLNGDHPKYGFCLDMMKNILGDVGNDLIRLDNKVIKNIAKQIVVKGK